MNSLPPEQRTMITTDPLGSRVEPIPGMGVCDFCTDIPVVAAYPCGLVIVETPIGTHVTSDPWGACAECRALIEADDRAGLARRSLDNFAADDGPAPAQVARTVVEIQRGFFDNRLGDAQAV
jgi:hypothetical protein